MQEKELTKKQQKTALHARIWVSGLIATGVFVGLMTILEDDYHLLEAFVQFVVFFGIWVLLHYIFLRKQFKAVDRS